MNLSEQIVIIQKKLVKPVVFIGTGGAGKTSIGKALAKELGLDFVDSDDVIVKNENQSIAKLFEAKGEDYFRNLERQTLIYLAQENKPYIIGTGGGAFMNEQTRQTILEKTVSIFIKADLKVLSERIGTGEGRPLFKNKEVDNVLTGLIEERYPVYQQADIIVDTYSEPEQETLNRVMNALYTHLNP